MKLFEKIFGTYSERQIKKLIPLVDKIESLDETMQKLSDEELQGKTVEFRARLEKGETLEDILPEAFAVAREAAFRIIGEKPYRVQIIGGIVLHQGRIAEMKTGEGKTLTAVLPTYLNALTGEGVHIITVNDYLAKVGAENNGKIYEFLGLTVGCIVHGIDKAERRAEYNCDVTYGTNNEFGFDYLRDNMVIYKEERVQRKLNFCIVDEVDSILIDEARTPLIISGEGEKSTELYKIANFFVMGLTNEDYEVDEKAHSVILTDSGVKKAESFFKLENYADPENMHYQHHVVQGLKAHFLMKREKDYVVKDGEVLIVDDFTGRLMEGRRYSDGLHQAIEAKERVKVEKESKTLATITFQNYFRMYEKLSGMTGTAVTEELEFREIYGLDVVVIPTNRPIARIDANDLVYKTERGKYNALVKEVIDTHQKGQPVLVGTVSIEISELISEMLKRKGIKHQVLNAKYHEQEAEIVALAGQKGAVTIATNMAGRGTDIKLGEGVTDLGGLKVIGTARHESRRIDNQLRGRSGRQGDEGYSRFYISLEDDLMRIFTSDRFKDMVDKLGLPEDEPIDSGMVTRAIEGAQKKVEGNNFDVRKNVLQYDDVMNKQREIIYSQRSKVLDGENLQEQIQDMIVEVVTESVNKHMSGIEESLKDDTHKLLAFLEEIYLPKDAIKLEDAIKLSKEELTEKLITIAKDKYKELEEMLKDEVREAERVILLKVVDTKWMAHIDDMDHLRQGIGLRAYRQQDPVQAYQFEGSDMFDEMIWNIKVDTIKYLYHISINAAIERERVAKETGTNAAKDDTVKKQPVKKDKKPGRNDECTCGSGRKFKNCCGRA
ncbi:preprotein translocase subunit SecA [Oceanirhabdus sp. W0125-5]|uniref:preprotein translocase subunit SecA n=1 Tax=Oceanirhabdus sp. W0125-5 TaxID=2999116 RepID=UPI0022F2DC3F|nr:preprotein translocase subunit SecA [Oceanirhabdus sp. W0125-5]WBW98509.1 preprotein translocase subunit SecA [Oceanirhabdus sp. W0125-5]